MQKLNYQSYLETIPSNKRYEILQSLKAKPLKERLKSQKSIIMHVDKSKNQFNSELKKTKSIHLKLKEENDDFLRKYRKSKKNSDDKNKNHDSKSEFESIFSDLLKTYCEKGYDLSSVETKENIFEPNILLDNKPTNLKFMNIDKSKDVKYIEKMKLILQQKMLNQDNSGKILSKNYESRIKDIYEKENDQKLKNLYKSKIILKKEIDENKNYIESIKSIIEQNMVKSTDNIDYYNVPKKFQTSCQNKKKMIFFDSSFKINAKSEDNSNDEIPEGKKKYIRNQYYNNSSNINETNLNSQNSLSQLSINSFKSSIAKSPKIRNLSEKRKVSYCFSNSRKPSMINFTKDKFVPIDIQNEINSSLNKVRDYELENISEYITNSTERTIDQNLITDYFSKKKVQNINFEALNFKKSDPSKILKMIGNIKKSVNSVDINDNYNTYTNNIADFMKIDKRNLTKVMSLDKDLNVLDYKLAKKIGQINKF